MAIQQDIRFCTTADGVQLAMALYGEGPPLVKAATWLTHIEADPTTPHTHHWIDELARNHRYVTYDARGCGLSTHNVADISLEAWVRDLEAVVDSLGLDRFPLLGISQGAGIAVAYAARHPERVSRLILHGGFATSYFSSSNPDPRIAEEGETLLKIIQLGWGTGGAAFRQVFVSKAMPDAPLAAQRAFDEYQNLTATPEMAARYTRAMYSVDVRKEASQISCPAIVFHSRGDQLVGFGQGRSLAARIPGARFVPLDSNNHIPFADEACWQLMVQELRAFLGEPASVRRDGTQLTARQQEVLQQVAAGQTDKQIARILSLSPRTVEMHVAGAMKALDCATRAEAVARAAQAGLLGR
jgi:pimeloyl-ACP methyl ester carboxylesterase/DNA-binding CsgD family transcriptional regulator